MRASFLELTSEVSMPIFDVSLAGSTPMVMITRWRPASFGRAVSSRVSKKGISDRSRRNTTRSDVLTRSSFIACFGICVSNDVSLYFKFKVICLIVSLCVSCG